MVRVTFTLSHVNWLPRNERAFLLLNLFNNHPGMVPGIRATAMTKTHIWTTFIELQNLKIREKGILCSSLLGQIIFDL